MTAELHPLNIGSIARGAAIELFDKAITSIAQNITDSSTDATATREITLKFKFKPEHDRRTIHVTTSSKLGLAAVADHDSVAYIGKDDEGHTYVLDADPRQELLFQPPVPEPSKVLTFGSGNASK
jgi:hypothetical protein